MAIAGASCQLVAGIRNDAELAVGGSASTSSSATSTGSSTDTTSTGGMGPCTDNAQCAGPSGVCVDGGCVQTSCMDSAIVDLFTSADLGSDAIDESQLISISDGDRLYIAIADDTTHQLRVRAVRDNGQTDPIVVFDAMQTVRVSRGRFEPGMVAFQGTVGPDLGEIQFTANGNGLQPNPTFVPFNYTCPAPSNIGRAAFSGWGTTTRFLVSCTDGTTKTLTLGGSDIAPTVVATGMDTDADLDTKHFAAIPTGYLGIAGSGNAMKYYWRGGATATDLTPSHLVSFSSDVGPLSFMLGAAPLTTGDGFMVVGARLLQTPLIDELWTGQVTDVTTLSNVPPSTMSLQLQGSPDFGAIFGETGPIISTPTGYFYATRSLDSKHAAVTWLAPSGQLLVMSHPVFVAGTNTAVAGAGVGATSFQPFVSWTEKTSGMDTIRGVFSTCTYTNQ